MDERNVMAVADVLSAHSYKVDALINILIQKGVFSPDEFNSELENVMNEAEKQSATDEYVIEEMKKKIMLK